MTPSPNVRARVASNGNPGARSSAVEIAVERIARRLSRMVRARVALQSIGGGIATWWLVKHVVSGLTGTAIPPRPAVLAATVGGTLVAMGLAVLLLRRHGVMSRVRAALWIEEQHSAGYALVTWIEQQQALEIPSTWLSDRVAQASKMALDVANRAVAPLARAMLAGPLLFAVGMATVVLFTAWAPDVIVSTVRDAGRHIVSSDVQRDAAIGAWSVRTVPPAYLRQPARSLGDVASVRAISGTAVTLSAKGASPDSVVVRELTDSTAPRSAVAVESQPPEWRSRIVATDRPMEVRVFRGEHTRLLLVEGVADSLPKVTLELPARDSVLRVATGQLPLVARLHDDFGFAHAAFEIVVSSGEGERFTARTLRVGERRFGGETNRRDTSLRVLLDLGGLQLQGGDVVHVRAMARDAHPLASREYGTSETRSFRIARASEYDSVAVEPAPPPDVDKSLMSQRMLLMLTERLERRRPTLALSVLQSESRTLARDQGRLRQAVGDAVFQRLTGDGGGEHSHSADDGHDHGVEVVGGKLAMSGMNAQGMLEEGDDAPVIAINKPLLEAYNAMWDAGRALEQSELRKAIPFMRIALEAIERARAAQRLYLRGRPPTVIVDLAKVRMVGKDTGTSGSRAARPALPASLVLTEARLLRAAKLVAENPFAARDSLAILRLESLRDEPAFASALSTVIESMNQGNGADITEQMLRARQMLGGVTRLPAGGIGIWSRGGPP